MTGQQTSDSSSRLVTPEDIERLAPRPPSLSSRERHWSGIVLQRFNLPSGEIDMPPGRDHILALNLGGRTLIEEKRDGDRRERRWSDTGDLTVIPAGQSIWRVLKGEPDIVALHLTPALVTEVAEDVFEVEAAKVALIPRLAVHDSTLHALGRLLLKEAEAHDPGSNLAADMLSRTLTTQVLRSHSSVSAVVQRTPEKMPRRQLCRVLDFMIEQMHTELSLQTLALVSGFSGSHFARVFRQTTGCPPHRYLNRIRLGRACELLENTSRSVPEIAQACGFKSPTYFATAFVAHTGLTPSAWRVARRI